MKNCKWKTLFRLLMIVMCGGALNFSYFTKQASAQYSGGQAAAKGAEVKSLEKANRQTGVKDTAHTASNADHKLPRVRPLLGPLDLSHAPTNEEIMAAGQLGGQLYPTHELNDKEREKEVNLSFATAMQAWNRHEYDAAVQMLKEHVKNYPDSPWAAEAILHVGCDANYKGKYTEAEESFKTIIDANTGNDYEGAKLLVNKATLRMGVLKVNQNNFNEAKKNFTSLMKTSAEWRDKTYASNWLQRLSQYSANELAMFSCGTKALASLLQKTGREEEARQVSEILPETAQGHSIKDITEIASRYGYGMTGLSLSPEEINKLPLPSIMHLSGKNKGDGGHYWILERVSGERLALFDPQAGRWFEQTIDEFARQWSGKAIVFSRDNNLPGVRLAESELEQTYGGCCGIPRYPDDLGAPEGNETKDNSCGAPAWKVNMVNMNLFMTDTPLWYKAPTGPSVSITVSYNSQSSVVHNEPFGNKWVFNYGSYLVVDTVGEVTVIMPDGRGDVYSLDGTGGYIKPLKVFNTLTKIAENHYELKFPDGMVYSYGIPAGTNSLQPFLVEIRDAHGQKLTFGYDASVRLTTITDAMGRVTTLIYDLHGHVTQATDPFGRSAFFEYDSNNNLTKITDMGGYWTSLSYDGNVYLTGMENPRGRWGFYIEPADGVWDGESDFPLPGNYMWENYRITVTDPLGGKELFYYSGYYQVGWQVAPKDYKIEDIMAYKAPMVKYNYTLVASKKGAVSKITYPSGFYLSYGYDSAGNRISISDSNGHTTRYTYNSAGMVTSVTDAKGNVTNYMYAGNGVDLVQVKDSLGTVSMTYNDAHDVTSITDRLNNKTYYTYNDKGQIVSVRDSLNTVTGLTYDTKNRLQQVSKDGRALNSFTYDTVDRVRASSDAAGVTLTYDYNNLDKVTKITYPDGRFESFAYSDCCPHLLDSKTDRSGQTVSYEYDPLKRLSSATVTDGGTTTKYEYDANGSLIKFTDANGNPTAYEYDQDKRLVRKIYADGKGVSFSYNSDGLLNKRTNVRGIITTYTYDQNHNLLNVSYSDGTPGVTYQYDNYNRVTQRTDGIGTYTFTYDANSRLTGMNGPWDNDTITYQYDSIGRLTGMTPQGGQAVTYSFDSYGRTTGINIGTKSYSYAYTNANPIPQSLTRPNGSGTIYQYDTLNRLTEIATKDSAFSIINQYDYLYNSQDLRSSETITNGNSISFTAEKTLYDYNTVNQLLTSTNPDQGFAYDADGNMTQGYTPEGYVFTAAYDAENRLKSLTYTDSSNVVHKTEYYYAGDSFLSEVKRYEDANLVSDTRHVRSGPMVIQERDGGNSVTAEYTWGANMGGGIGGLLNLRKGGEDYSYLYDGKGNVTAIIDNSQAIAATYTYDTFGNLMSKTGTLDQPYRFSTKAYDEKTGLLYYGYRFYSPATGRWINRDPLGEAGGMNLYGFVGNNPVNAIDPTGLDTVVIVGRGTGSNPFGHVAIGFTGQGVYSYGTGTPLGGDVTDYLTKQAAYRDSTVYTLNTTPEQEGKMLAEILKYQDTSLPNPFKDPKGALNDTCATRTQKALEAGDITSILLPFTSPFPVDTEFLVIINGATTIRIPKGGTIPSNLSTFNRR